MASKTFLVAQREYLENVRTKTFWLGIIIVPVLIAACVGVGALINKFKEVQRYTVVDLGDDELAERAEKQFRTRDMLQMFKLIADIKEDAKNQSPEALRELGRQFEGMDPEKPTGEQKLAMFNWMQQQSPKTMATFADISASKKYDFVSLEELEVAELEPEAQQEALNKMITDGELFAYFVLGEDPNKTVNGFEYVANNKTDPKLREAYERALTKLVQNDRIRAANINSTVAAHIKKRVEFGQRQIGADGKKSNVEKSDIVNQWAPIGFVYFLWIAIFSIANLLLTNTVEEKSNRIIEVLLSSVSPTQLMNGKIFGIAATGLTMVGAWVGFALLAAWLAPVLLGGTGEFLDVLIPALSNISYLAAFLGYFLGGFLLYAAMLVAIGSVCNTLKEAQNLMQPVMMILMVPLISMVFITQEPNGTVAKVLSFIPLFTPFTMMNRAAGPPEVWEYVVTTILLIATIWFAFKAAGKVFRVGVLMTGNPPKLKEILGWLWKS